MCIRDSVYPEPNYIILSGHNVHLYYVLEEPADLYPNTKSLLKDMKSVSYTHLDVYKRQT